MEAPTLVLKQWTHHVKELFPKLHGHQQKSLALAVFAMILAGHAVLQRMAEEISLQEISEAKMPSIERRLQRLIANERIDVAACWKPFLEQVLPFWQHKEVVLVLDCTPFRETFTLVYLGLLVHHRVLPLAWKIMPQQDSWEQGQWELVKELFEQIAPHFPPANCTLIADRGLACLELIRIWKPSQVAFCLAHFPSTPSASPVQARLVGLARWGTVHHTPRSTVVWLCLDVEGAQLCCFSGCVLGTGLRRGLDCDLRSACSSQADQDLWLAHAGGSDLSGYQKQRLAHRVQRDLGGQPPQSSLDGALSGRVVGGAFGLCLHETWTSQQI